MRDSFLKTLGLAPFLIHMVWEKITGLTGMDNDICLRNRAAFCQSAIF
jgi:hypothetical protein